eukprot:15435647-Alexandrium_andersonii.AAC.1
MSTLCWVLAAGAGLILKVVLPLGPFQSKFGAELFVNLFRGGRCLFGWNAGRIFGRWPHICLKLSRPPP